MKRLMSRILSATVAVGAVIAIPFIAPKVQHLLPGPDDTPDEVVIVQDTEEKSSAVEEQIEIPFESEQGSGEELSSDILLQEATVQRVIDGDTIIVDTTDEKDMRIRFIGMDTPESVHPDEWKNTEEGIVASNFTKDLLPEGSTVYLEQDISDTDKYDRYLRYIWLTEEVPADADKDFVRENMVNALLIDEGLADVKIFEPDTKYAEVFKALE